MDLPEITKVEAHDLQPGDLVVVTSPRILHREQVEHMRSGLSKLFPNQRVVLLEDGMTIQVYREKQLDRDRS